MRWAAPKASSLHQSTGTIYYINLFQFTSCFGLALNFLRQSLGGRLTGVKYCRSVAQHLEQDNIFKFLQYNYNIIQGFSLSKLQFVWTSINISPLCTSLALLLLLFSTAPQYLLHWNYNTITTTYWSYLLRLPVVHRSLCWASGAKMNRVHRYHVFCKGFRFI